MTKHGLSQKNFGELIGVSQGLVHQWLDGKTQITGDRARDIEKLTNGEVTRMELRPDLFGPIDHNTEQVA